MARYLVLGDSFQLAHAWNMLELLAQMLWIAVSNRILSLPLPHDIFL